MILQAVADRISLANVYRLFGNISYEDINASLRKTGFLFQQMEEFRVKYNAIARPVRLMKMEKFLLDHPSSRKA